ncbi:choline transporter-like protein 1 [Saccoglossus kowalevskii]|uniref:Choline transporter-like protein n=1 Tax=Saccoglossus kowalevskii TaxID=10224 RepID=A0ABM0GJQ2_SACKO|nr:PREDICTED: choline transporter-like protein 1-like [Saccoglossus kowalevskii]
MVLSWCCCREDNAKQEEGKWKPLSQRQCTDCTCVIIFILFWCGMLYIAAFSFTTGNVERLIYGYDSYGNVCNKKNPPIENIPFSGSDMTGKPHVFFMNVYNPSDSLEICVSKCPDIDLNTMSEVRDFTIRTGSRLCRYDYEPDSYTSVKQGTQGPCPETPVKQSNSIINRCIPTDIQDLLANYVDEIVDWLNAADVFNKVIADLYIARYEILGMCMIAFVIAILMVFLIRFIAAIIVWLIIILAGLGSITATILLWWNYAKRKTALDSFPEEQRVDAQKSNVRAFLIYSIIATVFTVILLLIILVMRKRIAFTVQLFHQAGKALSHMPLLLIQPLWTFIVLILFLAYWCVVLVYMSTAGKPKRHPETGFVSYEDPEMVKYFWWYHLVGLFWTSEFILACQQFIVATCVTEYYFTREKKYFRSPILKSLGRLISYHTGSLVLGAFIITLVKIPRAILAYTQAKLKDSTSKVAQWIMTCLSCCLWCFEKCLKYLNENAYIVIAIEGVSFCPAAQKAFITLVSNALRVAAINCVGDFVMFLGKLAVVGITAFIGLLIFGSHSSVNYYAIPILLAGIFAFLIAHAFFTIYEMTIDTLLLCFCEDCRVNDGSPGKEYFMDRQLMDFVSNSSEAIDNLERKNNPNSMVRSHENIDLEGENDKEAIIEGAVNPAIESQREDFDEI